MAEPLPDTLLAYLAGVVDALGRLRTRETDAGLLPEVSVSSPRLELLAVLAQHTGVRVVGVHRDYQRLGCSEHCDRRHQHVQSDTGRWQVTGYRATVLLHALHPYLIRHRADAARLVLLGMSSGHKASTANDMHRLGWPDLRTDPAWR